LVHAHVFSLGLSNTTEEQQVEGNRRTASVL
jgi:hypothetical protein